VGMTLRNYWPGIGLALLAIGPAGCGNYRITFEVADVINAPGDDLTREMLDVDIVMLRAKDAEKFPEIVDKSLRSDEWFRMRDQDDPKLSALEAGQIYALRSGDAEDRRDTLLGPALVSAIDRKDGKRETTVKVHHPLFLSDDSAIVIYGRFRSMTGLASKPPIVLQPSPPWNTHLRIKVGRTDWEVVNYP
jgi:hypothetical protein